MNRVPMLIRPSAVADLRAAAESRAKHGTAQRPPARPLNLPGAVLEKAEYEGGGAFLTGAGAGNLGVVQVDGPIWYSPSAFACYCGGGSAASIIHALARFRQDTRARAIVIDIHSPGGESMAMADLADAVRRAKAAKPVYVRMHETFSLGYAIACLGTELSMSPGTMVGSIGSIMWMLDESQALAADGLRFVATASGGKKLRHAPGQPMGDDVLADMQAVVDRCGADFFALVAEGRGIDAGTVASWQGGEFFADEAKALGLVDVIETEEAFYERISNIITKPVGGVSPAAVTPAGVAARRSKGGRMTATQNKGGVPKAMTADELYDSIASEGGFDDETLSKIKAMIPEETEAPAAEVNEEEKPASSRGKNGGAGAPASFAQLEEVVPAELDGRDALIVSMQREGVSVAAAQARVQSAILKQFKTLSGKAEDRQRLDAQTGSYSQGRTPVRGANRGGSAPAGNAVQRWNAAISAVMEERKIKRTEAVASVVRSNPDLHAEYLEEVNAGRAE